MKILFLLALLATVSNALVNSAIGDCSVINPIGNTIVTAGEKIKIMWANSHATVFPSIYLVQSDGVPTPIVIATNVSTGLDHIIAELPRTLVPSNAYYMTLGEAPHSCQSGNLRIIGATSFVPDPKTPGSLDHQISSGRFPKGTSQAASTSLPFLHITLTTVAITLGFILVV
ncbi:unnamed protein product [Mucor circinelloides]|uniref:Phytocyanin domain-containing protein n=1 Tax=Mucor circinelloides f. circinelloides (strain 1006PhL) TaxID=1220926 RepID=S2JJ43_MUCC1|nr:hypothetical protein HMPREF1544_03297 [Mucor circinelloides 1006PhL]